MNKTLVYALAGFVSAHLPGMLYAQETKNNNQPPEGDIIELSPFEVSTSRDIGYQSTNAAEVTRMNTPIEDIPMNVTIFNQEFLTDIMANETEDVLAYDASFTKTDENDGFKARGFGVNANYLDGFKQADGMGSQLVASAERIEILKGPAAVLWGQGGFGATVNRISKRPKMRPETSMRVIRAAWDTWGVQLDDTRPFAFGDGKRLAYRLSVDWREGNVYRGTPIKRLEISPSLLWQPGKYTKINLSYIHSLNERQGGWALPLHDAVYSAFPALLPGNTSGMYDAGNNWHSYKDYKLTHAISDDVRKLTRNITSADIQHTFSRHIQFRGQFQYEKRKRTDYETQPEISYLTFLQDAILIPRRYREQFRDDNNYRVRAELLGQFKTGPISHKVLGGYAWDRLDYDRNNLITPANRSTGMTSGIAYLPAVTYAQFLADPASAKVNASRVLPINAFDPDSSPALQDYATLKAALTQDVLQDIKIDNNEFYVNEVMGLFNDRLNVQGGVRYTKTKYDMFNYKNNTLRHAEPDATTYSFGAVWHLDAAKHFSLYGNMNSSFVPNYNVQPDGTFLKPTTGDQKEIGFRFNLGDGRFQGLISLFDIRQKDVPIEDEATGWYHVISDQKSKGMELALNFRVTNWWDMFGSYAYTDAETKDVNTGMKGVPQALQAKHVFTVFNHFKVTSGPLKGLNFKITTFYRGDRPSEFGTGSGYVRLENSSWTVPSAFSMDVGVGYNLRMRKKGTLSVGFRVKNIFDNTERFFVAYQDRFTPDPGREWDMYLGYKF